MDFNINDFGSVNDALQSYRTDIYDTLSNIGKVADVYADILMNIEDENYTIDSSKFPINLVYNDQNVSLVYVNGEGVHLQDGNGVDQGVLFDDTTHSIHNIQNFDSFDIFNSINESYTSNEILLEVCDLALIHDSADSDIADMISTKYGALSSNLSSSSKGAIDNIVTYLQHTDVGPTGVASYISELYAMIQDTMVNSQGQYYTSSDRAWYIQGFVGSYAIKTVAKTSFVAISAVVTVVKPLIGIALQLLVGAFNKIKQFVLDYTSAEVKVNTLATNNMIDMSLFDMDIDSFRMPVAVTNYFYLHPGINSVSFRMAGSTWIFTRIINGKFHLQIMCNVEFFYGSTYAPGIVIDSTHYKTSDKSVVEWMTLYGKSSNIYNEVNNNQDLSSSSVYDAQARTAFMSNYSTIFGLMAIVLKGSNETVSISPAVPNAFTANNVCDHAAYSQNHRTAADNSWNDIVIYRNALRSNTQDLGVCLCTLFDSLYVYDLVNSNKCYIACNASFPHVSQFYMNVPGYTVGAVWGTLITLGVVSTVAAVAVASFFVLKFKIRKFMARKQLDIEAKRYAYEGDSTDENFEAYWQSMKKYNKWAALFRYDKIDLASGYVASDVSETENSGYGENVLKKVQTKDGVKTLSLSDIYYLITDPRS